MSADEPYSVYVRTDPAASWLRLGTATGIPFTEAPPPPAPTIPVTSGPQTITLNFTGAAARAMHFALTGWPCFAWPPRPALPAPPPRLALPWGNSAYTAYQVTRWIPTEDSGDIPAGVTWCFGPPRNGLTPSSEGPRRADAVHAAQLRALTALLRRSR